MYNPTKEITQAIHQYMTAYWTETDLVDRDTVEKVADAVVYSMKDFTTHFPYCVPQSVIRYHSVLIYKRLFHPTAYFMRMVGKIVRSNAKA